jgi:hypothetical protein
LNVTSTEAFASDFPFRDVPGVRGMLSYTLPYGGTQVDGIP